MKGKRAGRLATIVMAAAPLVFSMGCSDVKENEVLTRKTCGGEVFFHDGPLREYVGKGTKNREWQGREVIDLPLQRGSEQQQNYKTLDGYLTIDLTVYSQLSRTPEAREKRFVKIQNYEDEFPRAVEGVVRSTVSGYTNSEILNEEVAQEQGKLPFYQQAHVDLAQSSINGDYGTDHTKWAVWPGNTSPLAKSVQADLERQRNIIRRRAMARAQHFKEQALELKAEVDGEYAEFIGDLSRAQQNYLQTLELTGAITAVAKEEGQDLDIQLFVR